MNHTYCTAPVANTEPLTTTLILMELELNLSLAFLFANTTAFKFKQ